MHQTTETQRKQHRDWLLELTNIPTAAGREDRVIAWVERWVKSRRNLKLTYDEAGNLYILPRRSSRARQAPAPLLITAHLDHPAFVVRHVEGRIVELEFRGGVHDPYFVGTRIDIIDEHDQSHRATITELNSAAKPFKVVEARLSRASEDVEAGNVARWALPKARVRKGILEAPACDDLAGVAAALSALDVIHRRKGMNHVGVMLTLAEEVGFIGAIAACRLQALPTDARLICLENSRSFPESPIGGGPIVRVGDRISVFDPRLTNRISQLMLSYAADHPTFTWQRKLMAGGACEATTFSSFGYESTCVCLPLGNYHNMVDIDGVQSGKAPARIGPEFIAVDDYHGLVDLLIISAAELDGSRGMDIRGRMDQLLDDHGFVIGFVSDDA